MSQHTPKPAPVKANARPKYGPQRRGGGGHGPMGGGTGEKAVNFGPSLRRLLGNLGPELPKIWLVIGMIILSTLGSSVGPLILGQATDLIFTAHVVNGTGIDFAAVGRVLAGALALYIVAALLSWGGGLLINGIVQRSVYRMRAQVSSKIGRLPLKYFDSQPRGELLSRVTNDVDNVAQSLQQTLSQVLSNLFTLLGVLFMMFWVSPLLAVVALVTIPIAMGLTVVIGKRSQKLFATTWKSTGELNSQIEESYTGHDLVTVFGRQRESLAQFKAKNAELFDASFGAQFISGIIMPVMFFVGNLNYVVIAVVGGLQVASGTLGLGSVQAFIQYSRMFTQPITQLASMANLLQSGVASAERVFEVLDAEEEPADADGQLAVTGGRVEFEHVDFSYDPDKPLITDLSLVAEPGSTVAIVGPTGAGKTTLVNLILRFYDLQGGRITLDGVDIASVPRRELRSQIGMVLQDTWLFGGTIRDNIAYGKQGATEDEILAAAKAAYVDRFAHSLPDGYDTVIDEEASNLSAGEKQLVTIARAFLSEPSLLILDEATSSVDTRTELLVQRAMKKLRADRTSFVIAHRLSTIRDADVILVMRNGAIVEQGTHDELLAAHGHYYRLYQAQFAAALTEDPNAEPAEGQVA
ncbi:MAG: ABC transporter ATP-binding protein [Propionicimonas sp.]|uniref:ABC transporter ATP-binding protein n=1 Tax=Propionicimonas sp. TaxID=1955623 RepID=UPI002B1EBD57|nr:ABC transporter ATP-binding protein [Propionicimonas sp.]MEA4943430.1 ABC transporter ATP-binding protein [Propionicimonas sp.]MEA5117775.1 ABC transporter ATP-binding protein [Propionicimonas sp.]